MPYSVKSGPDFLEIRGTEDGLRGLIAMCQDAIDNGIAEHLDDGPNGSGAQVTIIRERYWRPLP